MSSDAGRISQHYLSLREKVNKLSRVPVSHYKIAHSHGLIVVKSTS